MRMDCAESPWRLGNEHRGTHRLPALQGAMRLGDIRQGESLPHLRVHGPGGKGGEEIALADVAEAHRALEGRQTVGATMLIP